MKKLFIIAALMLFSFNANAGFGGDECNGLGNCNEYDDHSVTNKAYGGDGGKAYGGSAYQGQHQGQGQGQDQGQYQKNIGVNGQGQSLTNNGPQVEINDNKVITYEEKYQAPTMVAPGIDTSQVNVECPLYVQDGWSGSLSGPGAGASAGATDAEAIPACFALLAAKNSTGTAKTLAGTAFYCLSFEAAGVDNKECDGWRDVVRGGPAPTVRNAEVREGR